MFLFESCDLDVCCDGVLLSVVSIGAVVSEDPTILSEVLSFQNFRLVRFLQIQSYLVILFKHGQHVITHVFGFPYLPILHFIGKNMSVQRHARHGPQPASDKEHVLCIICFFIDVPPTIDFGNSHHTSVRQSRSVHNTSAAHKLEPRTNAVNL